MCVRAKSLYLCPTLCDSVKIFPVAQMVKNLSAVQEIWVPSLGQEDPLEEGMAIHSSILAWIEESDRLQFMRSQSRTWLSDLPTFTTLWAIACQAPLSMGSPVKNTRVGFHALLQGVFPTPGLNLNLHLLHCRHILYCRATGKPKANIVFPSFRSMRVCVGVCVCVCVIPFKWL